MWRMSFHSSLVFSAAAVCDANPNPTYLCARPICKTNMQDLYIYIARVCMGFRAYIAQRGKRSGLHHIGVF